MNKKETSNSLKRIFGYLWNNNKLLLISGLILYVLAISGMLYNQVFIGKVIVDTVLKDYISENSSKNINDFDWQFFTLVIVLSALLFMLSIIFKFIGNFILSLITFRTMKKIQDDLYHKIQNLPLDYLNKELKGSIMSAFNSDIETLKNFFRDIIPNTINAILTLSISLVMMFLLNWQLTFIMIGFMLVILGVSYFLMKKSRSFFKNERKINADISGYTEEILSGFETTRIFANPQEIINEYRKLNEEYRKTNRKVYTISGLFFPLSFNIGLIGYGTIALFGAILFLKGETAGIGLTIGTLISFTQFSKSFSNPISILMLNANDILRAIAGSKRIFGILDEEDELDEGNIFLFKNSDGTFVWKNSNNEIIKKYEGKIDFKNVSFSYNNQQTLSNVSFEIKPGQKVALVGKTGAGKTTIINLLGRFFEISEGEILIDNINIKEIKKASLRHMLGYVLQEVQIFSDTLENNIKYGINGTYEEQRLQKAINDANLLKYVNKLENGLDTLLHNSGSILSQGEKQLVSIARISYRQPQIIIFDEATSNIDSLTEREIQDSMNQLSKKATFIVIAHRLSTITNSDLIIVIDKGQIIEKGTHTELMNNKSKYYELINASKTN
ncbi:ABC transporter [Mycoplasmopsis canis]|uniref:ABC transporter ATP-binding protein n=1 Tax=Mycoplasmopsis canis TaxID=29555 RepID=UPI0006246A50|nr:ABC transporter ATP-binding protein [Mycoplasmopsis canis]AKF40917.1 ABC transporter [Mycoplasmopsis canis]